MLDLHKYEPYNPKSARQLYVLFPRPTSFPFRQEPHNRLFFYDVVAFVRHLSLLGGVAGLCLVGSFSATVSGAWGQSLEERSDDDFKLARNLFRDAGDYGTASELFADFIRNYPRHRNLPEARLLLAHSYARSGRCEQAVPAYEEYLTEHPEHLGTAEARRRRAVCWEQLGEFARAAVAHEEIQRLFPVGEFAVPALLDAAANYTKAQNLPAAIAAYERLIAEYASHRLASRARFNMARIAFASGNAGRAQGLLDQVTTSGRDADAVKDAFLLTGRIQLFLGKPALAEQAFTALRNRYPRSDHADSSWFEFGDYAIEKAQFDRAIEVFNQARNQVSGPGLRRRAEFGAAEALRLSGRYKAALMRYRLLAEDSEAGDIIRGSAQLGLAICYGHTDRFAEAIPLFLTVIQQPATPQTSPFRAKAMEELAALYRRRGDLTRSATWYRYYLNDAENQDARAQAQVRLNLAQVLDAAGYSNEAIAQFQHLLHVDTAIAAQAQLGMARAYEHGGLPGLALREYLTFLERFPAHVLAAEARRRVEYLREFTVLDRSGLDRALRQAWLDELGGVPRQEVRLRVIDSLRENRDYRNAVRQLETYVADYAGDGSTVEAEYFLADCMQLLARQRRAEGFESQADSLLQLALRQFRELAGGGNKRWHRLARFRLLDADLEEVDAGERARLLEERLVSFRRTENLGRELRAAAELKLADALRDAATDGDHWEAALASYRRALGESPSGEYAPKARFGAAASRARLGKTAAAVDSLKALLGDLSGNSLIPEVLFELGKALMAESRIVEGAARFEELLLAFPAFPERREVQMALASAYLELGSYPAAISALQQLQKSDPQGELGAVIRRQLARAYERNGDYQASLGLYEQLLSTHPSAAYADSMKLAKARLLRRLNRPEEAVALFERLRRSSIAAVASAASRAAGDHHFAAGRFDRAFASYEAGKGTTVDGLRAVCLYKLGRADAAKKIAGSVLDNVPKGGAWYWILTLESGRHYLRVHNYGRALKIFRGAKKQAEKTSAVSPGFEIPDEELVKITEDPAAAASYFVVTALWEQNLREPTEERAARALEAQVQFARKHGESAFGANVHLRLGHYYRGVLKQLLPAAGAFRHVVDGTGSDAQKQEAFWSLLLCYRDLFEWDEARRIARRLLEQYPDHPRANAVHLEIGYILKERGQYSQAIDYLEGVLEWARGDIAAQARYYIGESFQRMGRYRDAIEAYYRVSFHGSGVFAGWINSADFKRAQCHEELGELAQAASIYDRIIRREGSDSEYGKIAREGLERTGNR